MALRVVVLALALILALGIGFALGVALGTEATYRLLKETEEDDE